MTYADLTEAYLSDPKIQRQALFTKKKNWIRKRFLPAFGANTSIDLIKESHVEEYLEARRKAPGYHKGTLTVASVNRELAAIKHIFSWGVKKEFLEHNPARFLQQEKEDNVRDEILEPDQFQRLQSVSPPYLKPINLTGCVTGMRQGEILGLTWPKVDLKRGFIRLQAEDTKTKDGRIVPLSLSAELFEMFRDLFKVRSLHTSRVFLRDGRPIFSIKEAFQRACKEAGLKNFRFHDFRHTAVTTMRRAGIDHLTIMKITGHKTMVCFTRYNSFRESDLEAAARRCNTYHTNTLITLGLQNGSQTPQYSNSKTALRH